MQLQNICIGPVWQLHNLIAFEPHFFPTIKIGVPYIDCPMVCRFTLATYRAAVQYITDFSLEEYKMTDTPRQAPEHPQVNETDDQINTNLDPASFLREYVKPYAGTQPFNYSSQQDSEPLDRYALLACLTNYGNLL